MEDVWPEKTLLNHDEIEKFKNKKPHMFLAMVVDFAFWAIEHTASEIRKIVGPTQIEPKPCVLQECARKSVPEKCARKGCPLGF